MNDTTSLLNEISGIATYLSAARDIIDQGHMPDMSPLKKRMAELCASLEQAPDDVRRACREKFTSLLSELDQTEAKIKAWKA